MQLNISMFVAHAYIYTYVFVYTGMHLIYTCACISAVCYWERVDFF